MVPASFATLCVLIWIHLANLYLRDQNSSISCIQCHGVFIYQGIKGLEGTLGAYNPGTVFLAREQCLQKS